MNIRKTRSLLMMVALAGTAGSPGTGTVTNNGVVQFQRTAPSSFGGTIRGGGILLSALFSRIWDLPVVPDGAAVRRLVRSRQLRLRSTRAV